MSIRMLGIDHNLAPVDIRAVFSFTKKNAVAAMELLKKEAKVEDVYKRQAHGWACCGKGRFPFRQ